jgi:GTP-binding protein EngB required for normal cell division
VERFSVRGTYITLNASQRQRLLITCKHIDRLLGDIEATLNAAASKSVFPSYVADITPIQRKTVEDYIAGIRGQLLQVLAGESLAPEQPHISAAHSVGVNLTFIDVAIAELAPHYMRGYGPVSEEGAADLNGIVSELESAVKELAQCISRPATGDLRERVEKLARQGWDVASVRILADIIDRNGLTEFRPTMNMLLDRADETALEIAVFGRVSTGKSSLLNHVIGADLLPVGVTPITAVPTRIGYGPKPLVRVWQEGRGVSEHRVEELADFVDERRNPQNRNRVGRIQVLYPSKRLREGTIFVDTPGIGSLATSGATETLTYLPRCDAGIVLVDAGSTLTPDDLKIVRALLHVSTPTSVLLSKADLLSERDLEHQITYIKQQLQNEFGTELPVRPVSVVASHVALLEQWFAEEVAPLYERKQRLLEESLTRKMLLLAVSVRSALKTMVSSPQPEGAEREQLEVVDITLRRSAGQLQTFHSDLRRTTDKIPALRPFIIKKAAETVVATWLTQQEVDLADVLRSVAGEVAREVAREVRAELNKLQGELHQELLRTATRLRAEAPTPEDLEVAAEMPVLHMNRQKQLMGRPGLARLGRKLGIQMARRKLLANESALNQALESFSRLLYAWGMNASSELERRFDGFANRYRAQLVRLLLHRQPRVDPEQLRSDFEALSKIFGFDIPEVRNEAIAS